VQRQPHDRGLDDVARVERALELADLEAVQPRGERDVGRGRVLALERREAADRLGRPEPAALEQQLPCRDRGRQSFEGKGLAQAVGSVAAASRTTSPSF
jgi:hypothetical protein